MAAKTIRAWVVLPEDVTDLEQAPAGDSLCSTEIFLDQLEAEQSRHDFYPHYEVREMQITLGKAVA